MFSWVYFLFNLVHAAAHLLAARLLGIRIDRLSFGVGPTLWQRSWRGMTLRLALLPLGLLVRFEPLWKKGTPVEAPAQGGFRAASALRRLLVLCAPVLPLLLLAWAAAFHWHGVGVLRGGTPYLGAVEKGWPAEAAGLHAGDLVERIDGKRIDRWEQLQQAVRDGRGRPLRLVVRRETKTLELTVTPRKVGDRWVAGIYAGQQLMRVGGLAPRASAAAGTVVSAFSNVFSALGTRFFGRSASTLGGPITIWRQVESQAAVAASREASVITHVIVFYFVICLLPFPYLDGRRLLFWLIGLAARRPLHPRWEQGYNRWGLVVVGLLIVAIFAPDLLRLLS